MCRKCTVHSDLHALSRMKSASVLYVDGAPGRLSCRRVLFTFDSASIIQDGALHRRERLHGRYLRLGAPLDTSTNITYQISEWILLIAAYAFVGLRLYTRLFVQRARLRVSEWILIVAAIDALGLIICE